MYGKDPAILAKMASTFGKTASIVARSTARTSGKGGNRFSNVYRPPTNGRSDTVRLLEGKYTMQLVDERVNLIELETAFWSYEEHFDGRTKKSCVCSAGPFHKIPNRREPCAVCDKFWAEYSNTRKGDTRRWSKRTMFAFNAFVYGTFAEIDQVDAHSGRPRVNERGEAYKEWVNVEELAPAQYAGAPTKEGHLFQWPMGQEHYHALVALNAKIEQACKACGTRKVGKKPSRPAIYTMGYICPECQEEVIDLDRTELKADAIQRLVSSPMGCPNCHKRVEPTEVLGCRNCGEPARASIFDVDIEVQRVGANDGSKRTQLVISGFSDPYALQDEVLEASKRLYDLPRIYSPLPYEKQFEYFGITDDGSNDNGGEEEQEEAPPPRGRMAQGAPAQQIRKRPYPGAR